MNEIENGMYIMKTTIEIIQKMGLEIAYCDTSGNMIVYCNNYHSENPPESRCITDSSIGYCNKCKFRGEKNEQ